jgi:predicted phosphodiesterase
MLPLIDRWADLFARDELAEGAKKENPLFRYVVYGHTHTPVQKPIRVLQGHQDIDERREQICINAGT